MHDTANNGREAFRILKQHYATTEIPRILSLYEELTTLKMAIEEDTTDYLIRAEHAATGLRKAGETITDNLVIAMILKGLPEFFKPFVVVQSQLDKYKTLSEFKAALTNYANLCVALKSNHLPWLAKLRSPQECIHTVKRDRGNSVFIVWQNRAQIKGLPFKIKVKMPILSKTGSRRKRLFQKKTVCSQCILSRHNGLLIPNMC